jgi:hypothetical protein
MAPVSHGLGGFHVACARGFTQHALGPCRTVQWIRCAIPADRAGAYQIMVTAFDPANGNTGVGRVLVSAECGEMCGFLQARHFLIAMEHRGEGFLCAEHHLAWHSSSHF